MMSDNIISAVEGLTRWFLINGLDPPSVIRLKDKHQGIHFAQCVEREVLAYGPKARWKPDISFIDIAGIRFVWPMPEATLNGK
jgi:hypothetical protein